MKIDDITNLVDPDVYQDARKTLFPSKTSVRWYMRRHKGALTKCGAIVLHCNRWLIHAGKFDQFVCVQAQRAAQSEVAPGLAMV